MQRKAVVIKDTKIYKEPNEKGRWFSELSKDEKLFVGKDKVRNGKRWYLVSQPDGKTGYVLWETLFLWKLVSVEIEDGFMFPTEDMENEDRQPLMKGDLLFITAPSTESKPDFYQVEDLFGQRAMLPAAVKHADVDSNLSVNTGMLAALAGLILSFKYAFEEPSFWSGVKTFIFAILITLVSAFVVTFIVMALQGLVARIARRF